MRQKVYFLAHGVFFKYNAANSIWCFSNAYPTCLPFNRPNPTCNKSAAFSAGRLLFYPLSNSIFGHGCESNQTYFSFSLISELHFLLCPGRVECITISRGRSNTDFSWLHFRHKHRMHTHCCITMPANAPASCLSLSICNHVGISSTFVNACAALKAFWVSRTPWKNISYTAYTSVFYFSFRSSGGGWRYVGTFWWECPNQEIAMNRGSGSYFPSESWWLGNSRHL